MRYETADLIVVGGGAPGALAALQAVRKGMSVALIDRQEPGPSRHAAIGPFLRMTGNLKLAMAALEGWNEWPDLLGDTVLLREEHVDLAPPHSALLESLEAALELHSQPYRSLHDLNRPGWEGLRPPLPLWGIQTECWRLDATSLWLGLWQEAQRRGVRCFAETAIHLIDLEYDRPTAVSQETAFRGRTLLVCAGLGTPALLPELALQERRQLWRRGEGRMQVPHLQVHFAQIPVRLLNGDLGFQVARLHPEAPPPDELESDRLQEFVDRFLADAPPVEESIPYISLAEPRLGPHPLRPDIVVAAGHDYGLAPAVARLAVELCAGLEPSLT